MGGFAVSSASAGLRVYVCVFDLVVRGDARVVARSLFLQRVCACVLLLIHTLSHPNNASRPHPQERYRDVPSGGSSQGCIVKGLHNLFRYLHYPLTN